MATRKKADIPRGFNDLTQDVLRALLTYNPDTGEFTRNTTGYAATDARYAGRSAGYINGNGYVVVSIFNRRHRAHRLAWLYMTGEWPERDVDHRDGDRQNNRWDNLRAATRSENIHNMGLRPRNTSGRKGACFDARRGKWLAQITVNGKHLHLGRFDTREEAGDAYDAAAAKYFGQFARVA